MAKKADTHAAPMHGISRHHPGESAAHGQTQHGRPGMHGQRRMRHPTAIPAQARRDVWRRRAPTPQSL